LKDDKVALGFGFIKLVPAKDPSGRSITYFDVSRQDKSKYERKSMTRAMWYVFHAALEDEETQKKGIVILVIPRDSKLSQFDRKLGQMNADSLKGCIPIRMSASHICHPPTFFNVIFPIIKLLMGERLRKRTLVHGGSEEKVLETMATFGLTKDRLPEEFGGDIGPFHQEWLASRHAANK
jgi:CRAL/TRIO domain